MVVRFLAPTGVPTRIGDGLLSEVRIFAMPESPGNSQVMDFLRWKTFHRIVDRYGGDHRTCSAETRSDGRRLVERSGLDV
jgi:hypothetical protein